LIYKTNCDKCGGQLYVIQYTALTFIPIDEDGFDWSEGWRHDSRDAVVQCAGCGNITELEMVDDKE